jgi:hypothetical protein
MAFVHGKDSYTALDDTAGSLTDVSSYLDSCELSAEIELADVTAFGDEGHKNIAGLENSSFSFSGHWDSAEDDIVGSTTQRKAGTRTFNFAPQGNSSGNVLYTAEVWINSYSVSGSASDKVSFSGTLTVNGEVTRTTV